ncbi:MAG: TonB-dependent receptor plug domain-containing protein [Draconibacterium sp.]
MVDGMPGSLSVVAPEDVQSIEILKDAASTSIYGARASNGIILVTTKSGSSGKPTITARVSYGYQNAANSLERVSAEQYLRLARTAMSRSPFIRLLDAAHPGGGNTESSVWSTRYLNEENKCQKVGAQWRIQSIKIAH